ncbi:unnamed protein product [Adineta steineri]|uniref:Nuclear pore complex protein Nup88 n=1 Tax=Adineta steineri TaxID=433720 RepID=A0A814CK42_9BILA|nr:unnamed protein product [Adineta steineri]
MSLSSSIRIPFQWPNVDVFTFGKSSLYGYDSLNHCLLVHSSIELTNLSNISNDCLHLSSSPTWPIRRLILNEDETILALLADKIAYLVYLPQTNSNTNHTSPSKGSRLCPIIRVPPSVSLSSSTFSCSLIDFVWLTSNHFVIVYSIPSSSDCHLYSIRSSKQDGLEHIQTFSVGSSSKNKLGTPNKKISLHQPSDILKLNIKKREEKDISLILLFAMKSDGDIYLLEIEQNQLLNNNEKIVEEFQGPIRILPSTFDNYGVDHGQSTFICLSDSTCPLLVFTHDKCQLNQCIILSPSINQYYLFTIDSISLSTANQTGQIITSIIPDKFSPNKYYIADSNANIYLIEILWIDQVQQGLKQFQSTNIQHLIDGANSNQKFNNKIEQIGSIQIHNHGQYLAAIVKSQTNQQKELVLVRSQSSNFSNNSLSLSQTKNSEFLDRIRSLLSREQTIPYVTLSSLSTNISDSDLEKNLSQFIKLLTEQYIQKQEKVHKELENKQRYLLDFQQTQSNENKQLNEKLQQIQKQFQILTEKYEKECSRRKRLSSHVGDVLSVIEQNIPVLSDEEIRMQNQLESCQIQVNYLNKTIQHIQQFISLNQNQEQADDLSIGNTLNFIRNYRNQIDEMKQQLQAIQTYK